MYLHKIIYLPLFRRQYSKELLKLESRTGLHIKDSSAKRPRAWSSKRHREVEDVRRERWLSSQERIVLQTLVWYQRPHVQTKAWLLNVQVGVRIFVIGLLTLFKAQTVWALEKSYGSSRHCSKELCLGQGGSMKCFNWAKANSRSKKLFTTNLKTASNPLFIWLHY